MNTKVFNHELIAPIDFENPFIIDSIIKEKMLNHLEGQYKIKTVNLSLNRKDNYVLIVLVELLN
mgnify:CR=1 FL=1